MNAPTASTSMPTPTDQRISPFTADARTRDGDLAHAEADCTDLTSVRARLDRAAVGIVNSARIASDPRVSDPSYRVAPADADDWFRYLHEAEAMEAATGEDGGVGNLDDSFHQSRLLALVQAYAQMWGSGHGRKLRDEYLAQLRAAAEYLAKEAATVSASLPVEAPSATRTRTVTTDNGVKVSGHLPPWESSDPSEDNVPANRLEQRLADICFVQHFEGQVVNVDTGGGEHGRYVGPSSILDSAIRLRPHSDDSAERIPVVNVEVMEGSDDWIEGLDPDGVSDLAAKLRALADRLDNEVRPALVAARADWAINGGAR